MSNLTFRTLTAADAPEYQRLRLESLVQNPENFLSTFESEKNRRLENFEQDLEGAKFGPVYGYHGIFQDNQLLGYLQIDTSFLPKQRHLAFLYSLYISATARRQGLAKKLCHYVLGLLKSQTQVELIYLSYNGRNEAGKAFYKALGFKRYGVKVNAIKWQNQYDDEVEAVFDLNKYKPLADAA